MNGRLFCSDTDGYINDKKILNLEPYNNQDVSKIDFSQAGRVLKNDEYIVITKGGSAGITFYGNVIGTTREGEWYCDVNWRDITHLPETKQILELIEKLKTHASI